MIKQFQSSILIILLVSSTSFAQLQISGNVISNGIRFQNLETKTEIYKGKAAIYGKQIDPQKGSSLMLIDRVMLQSGIVEFDLAGSRAENANPMSRGFLGLAFRINEENSTYDCFYLRAENGRADDQLQRNHTVQYIASPDFEWSKLRKETPGKYETYVDMVPKEWTHVKVIIEDNRAEIYVNNASQPTMMVNELLGQNKSGGIALWVGPGTDAYFANLKITKLK